VAGKRACLSGTPLEGDAARWKAERVSKSGIQTKLKPPLFPARCGIPLRDLLEVSSVIELGKK